MARQVEQIAQEAHDAMLLESPEQLTNFDLLWIEGRWVEAKENAGLVSSVIYRENRKHAVIVLGRIARATGDPEVAWSHIENVLPDGVATEPRDLELLPALTAQHLAIELAVDADDFELAHQWLDAHDRWFDWSGAVRGQADRALLWSRYYREAGDPVRAMKQAEVALAWASEPRQPLALIAAHRTLGRLHLDADAFGSGEFHLNESLSLAEACAAPFEAAQTRIELAELYLSTSRHEEASHALEDVRNICASLQARPLLDRVDGLEHQLSSRSSFPAGLTQREVDVLRLVAQGMSDPEIAEQLHISPRTVNTHLTSIYRKLNVNSRTAAALTAKEHMLV